MAANLARREAPQIKTLFVPLLHENSKLSLSETIAVNTFIIYFSCFVFGLILLIGSSTTGFDIGIFIGIFLIAVSLIVSGVHSININDNQAKSIPERKKQVLGTRLMLNRPHASDEINRVHDVWNNYPRYSVKTSKEGSTGVKLTIVRHDWHGEDGEDVDLLIPWVTKETRLGFGGQTWDYSSIASRTIDNPTIDELQSRYNALSETARELEKQAYQEALKERKNEVLAHAVQIPGKDVNEQVKARLEEYDLDNGVAHE
jgi:hypothetical protein